MTKKVILLLIVISLKWVAHVIAIPVTDTYLQLLIIVNGVFHQQQLLIWLTVIHVACTGKLFFLKWEHQTCIVFE